MLGDDPSGAARAAQRDATEAIAHPGALEGVKHPPHGDFPGDVYAMQRFAENLVHGWDLARATGGAEQFDPELVTALSAWFDGAEDLYRQAGFIGPRATVADGADHQAALLARFGRWC